MPKDIRLSEFWDHYILLYLIYYWFLFFRRGNYCFLLRFVMKNDHTLEINTAVNQGCNYFSVYYKRGGGGQVLFWSLQGKNYTEAMRIHMKPIKQLPNRFHFCRVRPLVLCLCEKKTEYVFCTACTIKILRYRYLLKWKHKFRLKPLPQTTLRSF